MMMFLKGIFNIFSCQKELLANKLDDPQNVIVVDIVLFFC